MSQLYFWLIVVLILLFICFYFMKSINMRKTFFLSLSSFIIASSVAGYLYLGSPRLIDWSNVGDDVMISSAAADHLKHELTLDPHNQKILWFLGLYEYQKKNFDQALKYWKDLMNLLSKDSEQYLFIKPLIEELENDS